MNSLCDIRIVLGLVPKESPCIYVLGMRDIWPVKFLLNYLLPLKILY